MLVWVSTQNISEEWATSTQNHFVRLDLFIITSKSYIKEVLVVAKFSECNTNIWLKLIPTKAKLLTCHFRNFYQISETQICTKWSEMCETENDNSCWLQLSYCWFGLAIHTDEQQTKTIYLDAKIRSPKDHPLLNIRHSYWLYLKRYGYIQSHMDLWLCYHMALWHWTWLIWF